MAQPGGNVTGFMQFEYSLAGKWLELLKELAREGARIDNSAIAARPRRRGTRMRRRDLLLA